MTLDKKIALGVCTAFLIQLFFISPVGEFPLNDDWAHTLSIQRAIDTGTLYYPAWLAPMMHVPIIYGIALSSVFGFSFTLLRLSTLFFGLGALFVYYALLRRIRLSPSVSLLLVAVVWSNPIFFNMSYTFMGDIPALFFLLLSAYFYTVGFDSSKKALILAGSLSAVLGFFVRQTNIVLLFAAAIYHLWQNRGKKLRDFINFFALPSIALAVMYSTLNLYGLLPGKTAARFFPRDWPFTTQVLTNFWQLLLLIGIFTIPLTLPLLARNRHWLAKPRIWIIGCFVALLYGFGMWRHELFPGLGNIITPHGLGPSSQIMQGDLAVWGPQTFYTIVSIVGAISLTIFMYLVSTKSFRASTERPIVHFFALFGCIYFFLLMPIFTFDRYLMVILPVACILLGTAFEKLRWSKIVSVTCVLFFFIYSGIGTYNYLAWNKVRWDLGKELLSQGVALQDIEGGYEWNGWHLYGRDYHLGPETPTWAPWYVKELAKNHQMKYILSFSPLGGYRVIERRTVPSILGNVTSLYINEVAPGSLDR